MKRRSVQNAYRDVRPDEEAKNRMLNNIILSSEISPAGKDERIMRRKMKPMVIAAIIGLMVILMGSAVVVMSLQDLKIAERTTKGEILDSDGNALVETEVVRDVLSLHGIVNSPTYLAHQEWFEFYQEYSENHEIMKEENYYIPPEKYDAYTAYNQELMDKIDEIAEKYGLKLLGTCAVFQRWESDIFHEATGIETYLEPNSSANIGEETGYFYEGGNFKVEFDMTMPDEKNNWPYTMLNAIYYSKADNFDDVSFHINEPDNIEQWNYTTASGSDVLIIRHESGSFALIFSVRSDATIYLRIDTYYENNQGEITVMTKKQLEQVAEQFDYSVKVESVDMDLARAKLEQFCNSHYLQNESDEYASFDDFIQKRIEELGDEAAEQYFNLTDINEDGTNELIVGTTEKIEFVWMVKYGQMNQIMEYGENYRKLKEAWPDMEKKPITAYFSE